MRGRPDPLQSDPLDHPDTGRTVATAAPPAGRFATKAARRVPGGRYRSPVQWRVALGDVSVAIETCDDDRGAAVRRLFPRADGCPAALPSDLPVVFAARALPRPSREPDVVGDDVVVWSDGETVLAEHASGVRGWADAIRAEIGGEQSRVDLGFAFHRLFPILVTHLLGWRSRFVLHAGALVRDGSARLVLGGSGTGKSTLALAGGRDGWTMLADDLSVLRASDGEILVAGIAARTAVPADLDPALGRLGRPLPGDERGRVGDRRRTGSWLARRAGRGPDRARIDARRRSAGGRTGDGVGDAARLVPRQWVGPAAAALLPARRSAQPAARVAAVPLQ